MNDTLDRLKKALADRYAIQRELGRGGMATVYLADDLRHNRPVAIKVLKPELATALGPDRFLREIAVTAQLHHPMILPLLDSGEADGTLFYVMPYVEGESLRDRLERERQLPLEEALQLTKDVAEALGYAHSRGVIHRDIKPENILLESGHALVADFGIAKAVSEAGGEKLTETGLSIGTPAYMSPEQGAATGTIDARSDLYSLGCVLYEMLAGHPPFAGTTAHELLARHAMDPMPPLRTGRATVPEPIEEAVERALAKTPADRFPTVQRFAAALMIDLAAYRRQVGRRRTLRRVAAGTGAVLLAAAGIWVLTLRPAPPSVVDPTVIPIDPAAIAVLPFQVVGADSASPARTLARYMGDLFELKVTGEFDRRIRHPGSVAERWREAGGTLDSAISEAAELDVAKAVGAGRLVRGSIVVFGDSLVVSASMVDVLTGGVRVTPVRTEGTLAQRQELVDRLIVQLLTRDYGDVRGALPRLARYKPEAIQAWLAGSRAPPMSPESKRYYREALAADSTLVVAALDTYAEGERLADTAELRYAWEHQDWLSDRLRAYLQVLAAGRHGSIWTMADKIAGYEALTLRWPEWRVAWSELGQRLVVDGALASIPDWRRRAQVALERIDRPNYYSLWSQTELAFMNEDTASARQLVARLDSVLRRRPSWVSGEAYQWRLATLLGDAAAASRALASVRDTSWVVAFALTDARGVADADRVASATPALWPWGWVRGNELQWRDGWRAAREALRTHFPPSDALIPVFQALLLGMPEDSSVLNAVRRLERLADGAAGTPPSAEREQAVVWTALWRIAHGDERAADGAMQYLEKAEQQGNLRGWVRLLGVLRAQASGGDVRAALLSMDSVVRELPLPNGPWFPRPAEVQNLVLARMLMRYGEVDRALAAIRRRPYNALAVLEQSSLPEYLREEGRIAAAAGDTAGAIRAYTHYLALRESPDQLWRAPWDSVRAELAALVAR